MYNTEVVKLHSDMTDTDQPIRCTARERACVANAAQIISAKWTPQLIFAMANGVSRFCELQKEVGGINPRTLSARLDELEHAGIVKKASFAEVPPRVEYSLTQKGHDLFPILEQMVAWGSKYAAAASGEAPALTP
ncbi:MAG TPA: helix-turn-helix domain-containing protein [Candidatus Saccharimonadales bacterium]|nr:helix-turn-helix domain-containing protein [Candidatus Saccharimonadales bacterium]